MADLAQRTRTQSVATQRYLRAVQLRRRAVLRQIATAHLAEKPSSDSGLLDKLHLGGITDTANLAAKQIAESLINTVPSLVEITKATYRSGEQTNAALRRALGQDIQGPSGSNLHDIATGIAQGLKRDVTHPGENPGYLALDILNAAALGAGTAARLGRAGRAYRAARGGEPPPQPRIPEPPPMHPHLPGGTPEQYGTPMSEEAAIRAEMARTGRQLKIIPEKERLQAAARKTAAQAMDPQKVIDEAVAAQSLTKAGDVVGYYPKQPVKVGDTEFNIEKRVGTTPHPHTYHLMYSKAGAPFREMRFKERPDETFPRGAPIFTDPRAAVTALHSAIEEFTSGVPVSGLSIVRLSQEASKQAGIQREAQAARLAEKTAETPIRPPDVGGQITKAKQEAERYSRPTTPPTTRVEHGRAVRTAAGSAALWRLVAEVYKKPNLSSVEAGKILDIGPAAAHRHLGLAKQTVKSLKRQGREDYLRALAQSSETARATEPPVVAPPAMEPPGSPLEPTAPQPNENPFDFGGPSGGAVTPPAPPPRLPPPEEPPVAPQRPAGKVRQLPTDDPGELARRYAYAKRQGLPEAAELRAQLEGIKAAEAKAKGQPPVEAVAGLGKVEAAPTKRTGLRAIGGNPRSLEASGLPKEKWHDLVAELKSMHERGMASPERIDDLWRRHFGKGWKDAVKAWRETLPKPPRTPPPGIHGMPDELPRRRPSANVMQALGAAFRDAVKTHPRETFKIGERKRHVEGYEQVVPVEVQLGHPLTKHAMLGLIKAASAMARSEKLDKIGLAKMGQAYLEHKESQAYDRYAHYMKVLENVERAFDPETGTLRQDFLEKLIEDMNKTKDANKLQQFADTINQLAVMNVLYIKGTGYVIPNVLGQVGVLGMATRWNPVRIAKANLLHRGIAATDPQVFAMSRAVMGEGLTRLVSRGGGLQGKVGRSVRAAHGAFQKLYAPILDTPFRDVAFGDAMIRHGYDTPQKVSKLFRDHSQRGKMISIVDEANENIIDFTKLNPTERQHVLRKVFFYSWIKAASRWTVRQQVVRPVQSNVLTQNTKATQASYAKLLPPLPSFLEGIVPVGHRNVPGLGEVPLISNPRAVTVQGTFGDVVNTLAQNLSGNVSANAQLSQYLNPALTLGVAESLRTNPFTKADYQPDQGVLDIAWDQLKQMTAPLKLREDYIKAKKLKSGELDPSKTLFPLNEKEAFGRFFLGSEFPTPLNPKESTSRHFGEQSGLASKVQREYMKMTRDRETYLKAAKQTGLIKPNEKQLPANLRQAFVARAQRMANQAAWSEKLGHPLSVLERFEADLNLLVTSGKLPEKVAKSVLDKVSLLPDSAVSKVYRRVREFYFGPDLISLYKRFINQRLEALGEAPLTVP